MVINHRIDCIPARGRKPRAYVVTSDRSPKGEARAFRAKKFSNELDARTNIYHRDVIAIGRVK
jgi:hypothetical protein